MGDHRERGSVLLLMPTAVLVFAVLGGLCVDYGGVYAAQRRLSVAAEAAADDAATRALDLELLYDTGEVRVRRDVALAVVEASLRNAGLDRLDPVVDAVEVDGPTVIVRVSGRSRHLMARAIPGAPREIAIHTTATASAEESGGT